MRYLSSLTLSLFILLFFACNSGSNNNAAAVETQTPESSTEQPSTSLTSEPTNASIEEASSETPSAEIPQDQAKTEPTMKVAKEIKKEATKTVEAVKQEVKLAPTSSSTPSATIKPAFSPQKKEIVETVKEEMKIVEAKKEVLTKVVKEEKPAPPPPKAFTHTAWDQILRKNVSAAGKVNYKGIKAAEGQLDTYLADLAANPVEGDWSRNKKMAYWINAYNAFTIKLILDNYPVAQITQLHGGKPWDVKWIKLGSKTYSLNEIEHNILRPQFKDPRIHFAVNCAAKSCPPVLNRAWTEGNLNANLEKQSKSFVNGSGNQISAKEVKLSKIFDWYGEDFPDLIGFLNKYSATPINPDAKVNYLDYNWDLNE